jgi:hypothetical protein
MYTAFNNSKHRTFSEEQVDVELLPSSGTFKINEVEGWENKGKRYICRLINYLSATK